MKALLNSFISSVPISVYQKIMPRDMIGLCYHVVSDDYLPHVKHVLPYKTVEAFRQDLLFLKENYTFLTTGELNHIKRTPSVFGKLKVFLTFDDGYRECFTHIRPILRELDLSAIFFITTNFIDNKKLFHRNKISLCIDESLKLDAVQFAKLAEKLRSQWQVDIQNTMQFSKWIRKFSRHQEHDIDEVMLLLEIDGMKFLKEQTPYMTVDEIKQLADEGFVIGAHSLGHDRFSSLSKGEIEREIVESCKIISKIIEEKSVPFAFPFSANDLSRQHLEEIYQQNPEVSFLFDRNGFQPEPKFIVQRIIADTPTQEKQSNISQLLFQAYKTEARKKIVSSFQFKKAKKESTCKKEQPLSQSFQTSK